MATFGTTSEAGTAAGGATDTIGATKYTLSVDGVVTQLSFYSNASGNAKVGIYRDVSGNPVELIVANNTSTAVSAGWNDIYIKPTYLIAGTYWIAVLGDTGNLRAYIAGGVNQTAYNTSTTYANGLLSTFPAISNQNYDYVCYGTYTAGGGSAVRPYSHVVVGNGMSRSEVAN